MKTKIIEAYDASEFNWGKFMLCQFEEHEWAARSAVDDRPVLQGRGWSPKHLWILDLQTGEGFCTGTWGLASADLGKHAVWVCPMYEPFLGWLYQQDLSDLDALPPSVNLGEVPTAMSGYRREGPAPQDVSVAYDDQPDTVANNFVNAMRQAGVHVSEMPVDDDTPVVEYKIHPIGKPC